jgi:hypothetical protein
VVRLRTSRKANHFITIKLSGWRDFGDELYRTCHEAREVFLETYTVLTCRPIGIGVPIPLGYYNPRRDTVAVSIDVMQLLQQANSFVDLAMVENLAVSTTELLHDDMSLISLANALCPRLKSLTLAYGKPQFHSRRNRYGHFHVTARGKSSFQLLEITDAAAEYIEHRLCGDTRSFSANPTLPLFMAQAKSHLQQHLHDSEIVYGDRGTPSRIKFNVALLAEVKQRYTERKVFLTPVQPHPYNVLYFANKIVPWDVILWLPAFDTGIRAYLDRTIMDQYDGVKELLDSEY